ncbi:YggS family pyridoxal phosphate-dependent enzyme [Actinospica sp. MGRD01-02]|uniref:Pyridoxal phosphate homeostasis protein n=1 Tax=Actinospica acidithermotolerans TaxID=2828514 RepID=A0A941EDE7_9ACTN|nr:YggS family pyridoxal phosphate-dependent enzyme [Actinospica acidithermotolerans]MBR7828593.1 YggS family pyridoxal phosphate-dependent enzyme [Actinospica acidithermotolerans]
MADRAAEIAANLAAVRERIAAACAAAGRGAEEVTLVAVTKFRPASDVLELLRLGQRVLGENRDQEASAKAKEVAEALVSDFADVASIPAPEWHFIGQLQTNKVKSVVSYADVVESVDRLSLVAALDKAAVRAQREIRAFVQVNLDPEAVRDGSGRGGAHPEEVLELADAVAGTDALRLAGLMAVAPLGSPPEPAFERLAALAGELRGAHPDAVSLSAGMSGDLEAAVAAGATHVRIGTALLGGRPRLR